ncbi:MAG: DUF6265 family protein [Flavobacteriales bacterium]
MRKAFKLLLVVFTLASGCVEQASNNNPFDLSRLCGTWDFHQEATHEMLQWQADEDGNLIGKSFILHSGDTVYIDFNWISRESTGLTFAVSLGSSPDSEKISYSLSKQTPTRVEFLNAKYLFPQKIVYELSNDSTLVSYIEGVQEGERVRRNWIYQKK